MHQTGNNTILLAEEVKIDATTLHLYLRSKPTLGFHNKRMVNLLDVA
jgi:hypothetical protein